MPLARIVTAYVAEAVPLARLLREQGYSVEIVSPGSLLATPADVEFTVERRPATAALERAAEFSSAHDADVHVAPGTLAVERPLPKAPAAPAGDVRTTPPALAASPLSPPVPERQVKEEIPPSQRLEASPARSQKPETHPLRDAWQQTRNALRDAWTSTAVQLGAASRKVKEQAGRLDGPVRTGARRTAQTMAASSRRAAGGFKDIAQRVRSWEKRAHAKAAPRAAALTAAAGRSVAAITRTELQRAGRLAAAFGGLLRTLPSAMAAAVQRRFAAMPKPAPVRVYSARRREWNFALAGAALASLFLTLGWAAYTNRRPAAELLPRAGETRQSAEEGATLAPSAAPIAPPVAAEAPAQRAPVAPRQPAFARPESDEVAEDSVVYHGAPKSETEVEEESDDEVTVRHYPRKTREHAATPARSGVKKISDLDD